MTLTLLLTLTLALTFTLTLTLTWTLILTLTKSLTLTLIRYLTRSVGFLFYRMTDVTFTMTKTIYYSCMTLRNVVISWAFMWTLFMFV
uniref:NADH dehydrogenase subunit 5 n=1 Tax=Acrobeloides nanus TaxID=290746 RepID=A0A914DNU0_9BILA